MFGARMWGLLKTGYGMQAKMKQDVGLCISSMLKNGGEGKAGDIGGIKEQRAHASNGSMWNVTS